MNLFFKFIAGKMRSFFRKDLKITHFSVILDKDFMFALNYHCYIISITNPVIRNPLVSISVL